MPRYYFDISDSAGTDRDPAGMIYHSDIDAGNEAVRAVTGLARDRLYQGDLSEMSVIVRNEGGEQVLVVSLRPLSFGNRCRSVVRTTLPAMSANGHSGLDSPTVQGRRNRHAIHPIRLTGVATILRLP